MPDISNAGLIDRMVLDMSQSSSVTTTALEALLQDYRGTKGILDLPLISRLRQGGESSDDLLQQAAEEAEQQRTEPQTRKAPNDADQPPFAMVLNRLARRLKRRFRGATERQRRF
jgi:hypothetical protein